MIPNQFFRYLISGSKGVVLLWIQIGLCACLIGNDLRTIDSELARLLQEALDETIGELGVEGISVSISMPGYETWTGVYGYSERAKGTLIKSDSMFGMASITKTFVAAIIMQMKDEGLLRLDDLVKKYLGILDDVNENVTIRHLLSMTSGVYDFANHPSDPIGVAWQEPDRRWMPEYVLENFVRSQVFEPGERFSYSNTNYILFGLIIERISGKSFGQVLQKRLIDPLELSETVLAGYGALPESKIAYTDFSGDGVIDSDVDNVLTSIGTLIWTAGGMLSTSRDLNKWAQSLYGGKVLSRESLAEMTDFNPEGIERDYALGTQRTTISDQLFYGHSGWLSYITDMQYSPETGVAISFMQNVTRIWSGPFAQQLRDDLLEIIKQNKLDPVLEFPPIADRLITDSMVIPEIYTSEFSTAPLVIQVLSGPATRSGGRINLLGEPGIVRVRAYLLGNDFFNSAQVEQSFGVYSANSDDDFDGMSNLQEVFFGTNPRVGGSDSLLVVVLDTGTAIIRLAPARSDFAYWVESSEDLKNWSMAETEYFNDVGEFISEFPFNGSGRMFFRVRIELEE